MCGKKTPAKPKNDQISEIFKSIKDFQTKITATFKPPKKKSILKSQYIAMTSTARKFYTNNGELRWFADYVKKFMPMQLAKDEYIFEGVLKKLLPGGKLSYNVFKLCVPISEHPELLNSYQKAYEKTCRDEKMEERSDSYEIKDFKDMNNNNNNNNSNSSNNNNWGRFPQKPKKGETVWEGFAETQHEDEDEEDEEENEDEEATDKGE